LGFAVPVILPKSPRPAASGTPAPETKAGTTTAPGATAPAPSATAAPAPDGTPHLYDAAHLVAIQNYASPLHRQAAAQRYFHSLTPSEFARAFADLKDRPKEELWILRHLLSAWATVAPTEALQRALQLGEPPRSMSLYAIFS